MKNKPRNPGERDWLNGLHERRALKLMRLGVTTPEQERRMARNAGLPVASLRARARRSSASG